MGLFDKVKNYINNSDEDQLDMDVDNVYDDPDAMSDESEPVRTFSDISSTSRTSASSSPNIVDLRSSSRTPVVLKKIDTYQEVQSVADVLNEKRIVILNLETCPNDASQRIIDFLSGVAYANAGGIKKIAGRAYIITPDNVPLSGDLLEDLENSGFGAGYFES
ncbi:MAG: cell division protein SepF [Clostridia bacterium]|nr:cell division protein SepF [Clostridia bacterium]MBQ7046773.1 cell division protein SepF [Oscillospiraceae bacterium]